MKPTGPIPPDYGVVGGELAIAGRPANAWAAEAGDTPLFVYDRAITDARVAAFRASHPPDLGLHYAIKANPYPPLLRHMLGRVDGLDVASAGELRIALAAGAGPEHISFAGPGKRDDDLREAVAAGVTLNCESEGEAARTLRVARELGRTPRIAVRVNPPFELKGSGMRMGGGAKPFGVDAERVPALVRTLLDGGADWRGFHIFAGSQSLNADAITAAQANAIALAAELAEAVGAAPPLVNLGGGYGVPYFPGDDPLDIARVGAALGDALGIRRPVLKDSRFAIELGRFLVAEAGVYLTRVLDRKESGGRTFLVTDGGLHHQLAASGNFGQVIRRNFPVTIATRFSEPATVPATIVGCLCTPLDILADDVAVPAATGEGDLVAVFLAGAYGLSASPQAFLSQRPAREILA